MGRGGIERMLLRFVSRMLLCVLVLTGCSATENDSARGGGPATVQESKLPA
jgi:ribonuclease T1